MKRWGLLLSFIAVCSFVHAQPKVSVARYNGNCKAALTYTFDDGLLEHYTLVFPQLKQYRLKATFCVIGSKIGRNHKRTPCMSWEQLKEMAQDGQEISNHGYQHKNVTTLTPEQLRFEVQHNDTLIYNKVGVFPRSFFYPGNRKSDETVAFCSKDRVGTRTFQQSFGGRRDSLWGTSFVEQLLKRGEWGVLMTHGITEGYDAFQNQNYLWDNMQMVSSMLDRLWVATFHDVSAYITERDSLKLEVVQRGKCLQVTPCLSLDKTLFNIPLTLVVEAVVKEVVQNKKQLSFEVKDNCSIFAFNPYTGAIKIKLME